MGYGDGRLCKSLADRFESCTSHQTKTGPQRHIGGFSLMRVFDYVFILCSRSSIGRRTWLLTRGLWVRVPPGAPNTGSETDLTAIGSKVTYGICDV